MPPYKRLFVGEDGNKDASLASALADPIQVLAPSLHAARHATVSPAQKAFA